ncbi:periplasmic polysaccharide biosynthesis/export protein [Syntrophotalea acetylenivorans]|uniref:Periplasmic polysaccharide biosynthesis/export protein n=1 Tax=Syntrophotalea acetylenivorans TaxID=1842532 RepID=A0A1L3GM10_9BACT|nr:SLBB domain-containing protein [Syntrophotalea acetylenivorans]APG26925.1 periplasmic polysaccharide biosynthesis/export protein [Syntrophotalea acetylenivorans]
MKLWLSTVALVLMLSFSCFAAPSDSMDYRVGEGDVLRVLVYDNPDLETTTRISGNGTILFPLIGEVKIDGYTVSEVAQDLSKKLAQGYIIDPQVSVFVQEFRSQKTIIMGEVKVPGLYELSGPSSLMELISKAGGLTIDAGDLVTIKRKDLSQPEIDQIISVSLKSLLEKKENVSNLMIVDGDSVFVPRAGVFYVTGQVNRPAAYKLEEGTSVIKAITMAGGFTELASQRKIQIIRKVDDKESVLKKVPLHTPVQADDVIVVPESFF